MPNLPAVNLARQFWPEYFQQPREYFNEEQIVEDLYKNIRINVYSFSFLVKGDEKNLRLQHDKKKVGEAIRKYYAMNDVEFPLPEGFTVNEYSYHVLRRVWQRIQDEITAQKKPRKTRDPG
jgi:hypothetical protein